LKIDSNYNKNAFLNQTMTSPPWEGSGALFLIVGTHPLPHRGRGDNKTVLSGKNPSQVKPAI
jgi:hypothetical protein